MHIKLSDSDNETLNNLWHTEPALRDSCQLINSRPNADARKAAPSPITKVMIEGPSPRHKYVIMLDPGEGTVNHTGG